MAINMNVNLRSTDGWVLLMTGAGSPRVDGSGNIELYVGAGAPPTTGADPGFPLANGGSSLTLAAGDKLYARCVQLGSADVVDTASLLITGANVLVAASALPATFTAYKDVATGTAVWSPTNKTAGSVATVTGDARFGTDIYGRIKTLAPIADLSSVALTYTETPVGGAAVNTTINGTISTRPAPNFQAPKRVAPNTKPNAGDVLATITALTTGSTLDLLDENNSPYTGTEFVLTRNGNTATIVVGLGIRPYRSTRLHLRELPPGVVNLNAGFRQTLTIALPPYMQPGVTLPVGPSPGYSGAPLAVSGAPQNATVGAAYPFTPLVSGGIKPYTLTKLSGTLPPGRLVNGLSITGAYTSSGAYNYVLRITDSANATVDLAVNEIIVSAGGLINPVNITVPVTGRTLLTTAINGVPAGNMVSVNNPASAALPIEYII